MPHLPATGARAACELICYDSSGRERTDDPDGLMSDRILRRLAADDAPVTDVFLLSHGWMGDIPAARKQYANWLEAMAKCEADAARMRQVRPNFTPLHVGIHWPSKPWGDESFGEGGSFSVPIDGAASADPVQAMVDDYAAASRTRRPPATPSGGSWSALWTTSNPRRFRRTCSRRTSS